MRYRAWIVACAKTLALVPLVLLGASEGSTPVPTAGNASVSAMFGKVKVVVAIQTARIEKASAHTAALRSGSASTAVTVIEKLDASVNDRALYVPRSVFADLLNPAEASLSVEDSTTVLVISGGDASESYVLRIYLDSKGINRRTLSSSLQPGEPTQETRYWRSELRDD